MVFVCQLPDRVAGVRKHVQLSVVASGAACSILTGVSDDDRVVWANKDGLLLQDQLNTLAWHAWLQTITRDRRSAL